LVPEIDPASGGSWEFDIESLLKELRDLISSEHPHLLKLFDVFAAEARFARQWLEPNLRKLKAGSQVLEVGAGLMLVSCQLMREGYQVTALEPVGEGFSGFLALQGVVLNHARGIGIAPTILALPVERLDKVGMFSFAFSVNVMEHIESLPACMANIVRALAPAGIYRFTCPNYLFPYEPHFDIPTLLSKSLTGRVFRKRILESRQVEDQMGLWRSLNWINVFSIQQVCRRIGGVSVDFDRSMFGQIFTRVVIDPEFAARRSRWVRVLAAWMVRWRLHEVLVYCPAVMMPTIDCTVIRTEMFAAVPAGGTR
jgi:SAM-dependent methyltransferase